MADVICRGARQCCIASPCRSARRQQDRLAKKCTRRFLLCPSGTFQLNGRQSQGRIEFSGTTQNYSTRRPSGKRALGRQEHNLLAWLVLAACTWGTVLKPRGYP